MSCRHSEPDGGLTIHIDASDICHNLEVVIPAKAGIQKARVAPINWIPAFAGMTKQSPPWLRLCHARANRGFVSRPAVALADA